LKRHLDAWRENGAPEQRKIARVAS
jgi:hypothetical protein